MAKLGLEDLDLAGKRVLVRVDFNVPMDEAGNVLEAMQSEIAEGRSLFTARVDASIQEMRDFLTEELLRVAEAKGKS